MPTLSNKFKVMQNKTNHQSNSQLVSQQENVQTTIKFGARKPKHINKLNDFELFTQEVAAYLDWLDKLSRAEIAA